MNNISFFNQMHQQYMIQSQNMHVDIDNQCACDSILSRVIYGYAQFMKSMKALYPKDYQNLPFPKPGSFGGMVPRNTPGM